VILSVPEARSQNFIVRSEEPVTKNLFAGSVAIQRIQP